MALELIAASRWRELESYFDANHEQSSETHVVGADGSIRVQVALPGITRREFDDLAENGEDVWVPRTLDI